MQPHKPEGAEPTGPHLTSPVTEAPAERAISEIGIPTPAPSPAPGESLATQNPLPDTPAVTTHGASQKFAKPLALLVVAGLLLLTAGLLLLTVD